MGEAMKRPREEAVGMEDLEKIGRYTRRKLDAEEVYVFSVVLCDNEIDRDGERFPRESLEKLGELFLGKTGVFDHAPKAENQSARIFETALEPGEGRNSLGEAAWRLKARAYMARCEKTKDLILEIDAGIKKEVSVGCAVGQVLCSICGADQKAGKCEHSKGEMYGGEICHHLLCHPTDAFEWSFVAVPAQRNAGVTKRRGDGLGEVPVEKLLDGEGDLHLQKAQAAALRRKIRELEELAREGERYREGLRKEVVRVGLLAQPDLGEELLHSIARSLDPGELGALRSSFLAKARERYPLGIQLGAEAPEEKADDAFLI